MRSRRRARKARSQVTVWLLVWSVIALVLMAIAAYKGSVNSADRATFENDGAEFADADVPDEADVAGVADADAPAGRPVYRYSVIPGGAYDARELAEAVDRDPVVAAEYRGVAAGGVRAEVVPADRMAYMSYRIADKIYWTKHQIKLRRGETILTNGEAQLRGRCGNGISLEPMQPTAEAEPAPLELEALAPGESPLLASHRLPFDLASPGGLSSGLGPLNGLGAGSAFGGPFGASDSLFPGGGLTGTPPTGSTSVPPVISTGTPDTPVIDVPPVFPGPPPGLPGTPPGQDQIIHQIVDIATGTDTIDEPPGGGDGPTFPTGPEDPGNPVPTPEPGTMLLVGGGVVSMVLRKRRSKKQQD